MLKRYLVAGAVIVLLAAVWLRNGRDDGSAGTTQSLGAMPAEANSSSTSAVVGPKAEVTESASGEDGSGNRIPAHGPAGSVVVRVSGLRAEGTLRVALFDRTDGFPDKSGAARTMSTPVAQTSAELVMGDLKEGTYAIAVFEDLNNDGVLNKGAFGVPVEPYGFSNNVRGKWGPPSFGEASFKVSQDPAELEIRVQ